MEEDEEEAIVALASILLQFCAFYKFKLQLQRQILNNSILLHQLITEKQQITRSSYCNLQSSILSEILNNPDVDMKEHVRLSRASFHRLQQLLAPKNRGWNADIELLVFLIWLASGATYRGVASQCGISTSTVFDIVRRTLQSILNIMRDIICLPSTTEEAEEIGQGFATLSSSSAFATVVGCLDSCRINIIPPKVTNEEFLAEEEHFKVQLQAVTDHRMIFLDICVGNLGPVEDVDVLRCSPLYTEQLYPPIGYQILGSPLYPCIKYPITILTPFQVPMNSPVEAQYNSFHSRLHSVVDRAFDQMKRRWQNLYAQPLKLTMSMAPKVVAVCAVLHNICLLEGDEFDVSDDESDDSEMRTGLETETPLIEDELDAYADRMEIAEKLPEPVIVPVHMEEHNNFSIFSAASP